MPVYIPGVTNLVHHIARAPGAFALTNTRHINMNVKPASNQDISYALAMP